MISRLICWLFGHVWDDSTTLPSKIQYCLNCGKIQRKENA